MRLVVALGGNALLRRDDPPNVEAQRRNLHAAAGVLADLAREHSIIVTHGNGPQVGLLALQTEAIDEIEPMPLDVLGAQTQGMIGYWIEDELRDALDGSREVATLLTQVAVDAADPAFDSPSKPIGRVYEESQARRLAAERGWTVAPDGDAWRRVVASPEPRRILEVRPLRLLLEAGVVVICAGGGGVPVVEEPGGGWRGVEAVVDKDLSAALLAEELEAEALLLLTDVDAAYADWPGERARAIRRATPTALRSLPFAAGSMGPKVEAACRFAEGGRGASAPARSAWIGALADAASMLRGQAGTWVSSVGPDLELEDARSR